MSIGLRPLMRRKIFDSNGVFHGWLVQPLQLLNKKLKPIWDNQTLEVSELLETQVEPAGRNNDQPISTSGKDAEREPSTGLSDKPR